MMAKIASDYVLDGALERVAGATRLVALNGAPASYAAADAGRLAEVAMTPADFVIADGGVSGRRVSVAAKIGVPVVVPGTADHVALLDGAAQRLLYVTTCPARVLPEAGLVNIAGWQVEIGDPV